MIYKITFREQRYDGEDIIPCLHIDIISYTELLIVARQFDPIENWKEDLPQKSPRVLLFDYGKLDSDGWKRNFVAYSPYYPKSYQ